MTTRVLDLEGPFALGPSTADRLERRIAEALALARRRGTPAVASVTQPVDPAVDLSATVLSSRRPGDRYVCIEQPGRDGHTVCGLGATATLHASGPGRFARVAAEARDLNSRTLADDPAADPLGPPGSGPVHLGGFAFSDAGGQAPEWAGFAAAQLVLPEVSFARQDGAARMTVSVAVEGDESPAALLERCLLYTSPSPRDRS